MVRILGVLFAVLLAAAHADGAIHHSQLSVIREHQPLIGYSLFILLLGIGVATARTAFRAQQEAAALLYIVATGLVLVVVATPSGDGTHWLCAVAVMLMMYIYYALLLHDTGCGLLFLMHVMAPLGLIAALIAADALSFGIFQKSVILYLVGAMLVHEGALAREHRASAIAVPKRGARLRLEPIQSESGFRSRATNR